MLSSQTLPISWACSSQISTVDEMREKRAPLAMSHTIGEAGCSLTHSLFYPQDKSQAKEDHSWPWAVQPWGRDDVGKVKLFLLPSPRFQTHIFFFFFLLQQFPRTSLETWASTKSFALVGNFLRQSLPGVPRLRQRRTAAGLWTLQGPQAGPRFVCLLPGRYDFS